MPDVREWQKVSVILLSCVLPECMVGHCEILEAGLDGPLT